MKRILEVGDIIKIVTKDRKDAWLDYTVKIVEVTSRCAKGKQMFRDGSLYCCGAYHPINWRLMGFLALIL